ncbi:Predicted dehydrogenase [Fodinibius roseus]|uniref:Predicted dehydrogenase n=1 Tax=Fodinibius roseus TaxID=1194090 RepID=A0A1M4YNF3_9BACT|nr:Gfo/Idh/MocA family oxidoreductase [Fodinibius roseus]SHF07310.1 Predicted dehydrogenase [Fodinibius roseus]
MIRRILFVVVLLFVSVWPLSAQHIPSDEEIRIGIIGLDTSHSLAYAKLINQTDSSSLAGLRVVAAYPKGNPDLATGERIPEFTEDVRKLGIEIVGSIDELLARVDVVMLETRDGRMHLEQALPVLKAGKPLYIDAPLAGSLGEAIAIYEAAQRYNVPVFTAEPLRYTPKTQAIAEGKVGEIIGAATYSPAPTHPTHSDLFWYGGHGVAMLYTVMGPGCEVLWRVHTQGTDAVICRWEDDRLGTYRGIRSGKRGYGGTAFGTDGIVRLGGFEDYLPVVLKVGSFFKSGKPPVSAEESLEIYAFMAAADKSKRLGGQPVYLEKMLANTRKEARQKLEQILSERN